MALVPRFNFARLLEDLAVQHNLLPPVFLPVPHPWPNHVAVLCSYAGVDAIRKYSLLYFCFSYGPKKPYGIGLKSGAMTLRVTTLSITAFNITTLSITTISITTFYIEGHYAESHLCWVSFMLSVIYANIIYAECRYAACRHAECRGAFIVAKFTKLRMVTLDAECHLY